jgi:hypothetical protein
MEGYMKKILVFLCVVVIGLVFYGCMPKRDVSKFEYLRNPAISEQPAQRVIVSEVLGDPNNTGKSAIKALFMTYFQLKGKVKTMPMAISPRARWPKGFDVPKDQWVAMWALPVPDSVTELPSPKKDMPVVRLDTWQYGTTAEILHVGSYSEETPAIEKLKKFITDNGYIISGDHEEEYLIGPGMFSKGDPKKYYTIIRYSVQKAPVVNKKGK